MAELDLAREVAGELYFITVTDPWYKIEGGNWEAPTASNQGMARGGLFDGIKALKVGKDGSSSGIGLRSVGSVPIEVSKKQRHATKLGREEWIKRGKDVVSARKGVCTDCAAAAAQLMLTKLDLHDREARVEIVSTGTHAFVILDREGDIHAPDAWGADACLIDVWMQNQYPEGQVNGAARMSDSRHPVVSFIQGNAGRLSVEVELRSVIGSLF